MKITAINGRWNIWTTDSIADWDGLTGDPSVPCGWEHERFASMHQHCRYGYTFYDIGTEHGAISTVIAREFVGAGSMVLMEPSPGMWPNIRKHWLYNGLEKPLAFWDGFVSDETSTSIPSGWEFDEWPALADPDAPETGGMPYRSLTDAGEIFSISVDDFVHFTHLPPMYLNIDVEGAELRVLRGAEQTLVDYQPLVWVSIHPDLMERDFGSSPSELIEFMASVGYEGEHLSTDHEEHHFFQRAVETF